MKDYRKTKARFFLGLFFFLSLTGLGITWIIYSALTKEVEVGKYESSFPALIARIIRLSSSAVLGIAYLTYLIVTYFKKPLIICSSASCVVSPKVISFTSCSPAILPMAAS